MNLLEALYQSYNYAEENDMVDLHDGSTILLPLFHNNLRSTGDNIVEISLRKNGDFFGAEFIKEDQYVVFPVTYSSVTRSGKMPPAHPLMDKAIYMIPSQLNHHKLYREEFLNFKKAVKDEKVREFLDLIDEYMLSDNWFDELLEELYQDYSREDLIVKFKDGKREKKHDFKNIYLSFKILDFIDYQDISIDNYRKLHKEYISYVEENLEYDGICNLSGKKDFISRKHRGFLGNAKLIGVSNNIETYKGRFKKGDDLYNLGYVSSEKIHLMLRYLIENPNSSEYLGENQYLINWFSDDIGNKSQINIRNPNKDQVEDQDERVRKIVNLQNKEIGSSFIKGQIRFQDDANYYILILDKSSPGRISAKYFKSLAVSQLLENLKKWTQLYRWPSYIEEVGGLVDRVASFYNIMVSSYGVEREGRLVVDNKKFAKDQIQKMIGAMMEGEKIQSNIIERLKDNIRKRNNYDKTWSQMKRVALSILRNEREESYSHMLDRENMNRSYLYGRLLAVYEMIEASNYGKDEDKRITNAEKFWTAYINNPARTQLTLERNVNVYLNKLSSYKEKDGQASKIGLAIKYKKAKSEIIGLLDKIYKEDPRELSKPLEFDFIFGYEAQKAELFKRSKDEEEK